MKTLSKLYEAFVEKEIDTNSNTIHRIIADAFRRCVSVGEIKRLRNLESLEIETNGNEHKGLLEFEATVNHVERKFKALYSVIDSNERIKISIIINLINEEVSSINEELVIEGIDLQNQVILLVEKLLRNIEI
ncbi:gp132 [Sphingomonas phage PAU]|uniref:gp132 n=1 Tax=Sphingomonas phage PAU TaxID=1150991 RepID=UPI0002573277|nr:gp132 [Sphingomonas phage PAU]AFF28130.1 gp132 [Sphingomonas phage PAU]